MKEGLEKLFNTKVTFGLILIVLTTLFLFLNYVSEPYELSKFIAIAVITGVLALITLARFLLSKTTTLVTTPIHLPLLLLAVGAGISTYMSPSQYIGIFGNHPLVHGSLVSIIVYTLLYFITVNNLKNTSQVKYLVTTLIISGALLSVLALLSYWGVKIFPLAWTHVPQFTPTGSSFSTAAVLTLLLPFTILGIVTSTNVNSSILFSFLTTLFGLTIVLIAPMGILITSAVLAVITLVANSTSKLVKKLPFILVPVILVGLISALYFIPPIGNAKNPLFEKSKQFPREVQLPFDVSWKISASSFRDQPFWGTGPGTFIFNFTEYKPVQLNSTIFWNTKFNKPYNEYLNVLSTLGAVGLLLLISITFLVVWRAYLLLKTERNIDVDDIFLRKGLSLAAIGFFLILAFNPSSLVLWVIGVLILASFMVVNKFSQLVNIRLGAVKAGQESVDIFPILLSIIIIPLLIYSSIQLFRFTKADYYSLSAASKFEQTRDLISTYNTLLQAEQIRPLNDSYRANLSRVNFAIASQIVAERGPKEGSPSGSLTDQDKVNIQNFLTQSINSASAATVLSPRNSVHWEHLATIYRQIAGVATDNQNIFLQAMNAYGRAIQQDPLNPLLRINVGTLYHATRNYDMAIRFFTDAVNLKPDLPLALYNLSIALRDKGDLQSAQQVAERAISLINPEHPDYEFISKYLSELKQKISEGQSQPKSTIEESGLQNDNLPKVVNVEEPEEKVATPAAAPAQ